VEKSEREKREQGRRREGKRRADGWKKRTRTNKFVTFLVKFNQIVKFFSMLCITGRAKKVTPRKNSISLEL